MRSFSFLLAFAAFFFVQKIEAQNAAPTEPIFIRHSFIKGAMVAQGGTEHRVGVFYRGLKKPLAATPESKKLFKKARRQLTTSFVLNGVSLALIGTTSVVGAIQSSKNEDEIAIGTTCASLGMIVGSFILARRSGKNLDAAVEAHNRAIKKK